MIKVGVESANDRKVGINVIDHSIVKRILIDEIETDWNDAIVRCPS